MGDITILGQLHSDSPPSDRSRHSEVRPSKKSVLTLSEASSLSGLPVHELKEAISTGRLRAERRGRYVIRRPDLDEFMHS